MIRQFSGFISMGGNDGCKFTPTVWCRVSRSWVIATTGHLAIWALQGYCRKTEGPRRPSPTNPPAMVACRQSLRRNSPRTSILPGAHSMRPRGKHRPRRQTGCARTDAMGNVLAAGVAWATLVFGCSVLVAAATMRQARVLELDSGKPGRVGAELASVKGQATQIAIAVSTSYWVLRCSW